MNTAMALMRINDFHMNIKEIGATGGGAHKFSSQWDNELGIRMAKQDEMDSLVAGMQFVLCDKYGECYTFKPSDWNPYRPRRQSCSNTEESNSADPDNSAETNPKSSSNSNVPDQWWASKKVRRDDVSSTYLSSAYPYLLVSIGT